MARDICRTISRLARTGSPLDGFPGHFGACEDGFAADLEVFCAPSTLPLQRTIRRAWTQAAPCCSDLHTISRTREVGRRRFHGSRAPGAHPDAAAVVHAAGRGTPAFGHALHRRMRTIAEGTRPPCASRHERALGAHDADRSTRFRGEFEHVPCFEAPTRATSRQPPSTRSTADASRSVVIDALSASARYEQ